MKYAATTERSTKVKTISEAHGGQVYAAARRWAIDPDRVLDFSANINPLGTPQTVLAAIGNSFARVKLETYPDVHDLVSTLAEKNRLAPDEVVVGSGAASLMFAALHAILPANVLVLEPAFSEYSRACAAAKAQVTRWILTEEDGFTPDFDRLVGAVRKRKFDLVILNSPHNPTGTLYPREELLSVVSAAEAHNVVVMLDEAFIDYAPENSLLSVAPRKTQLIVVRSLTKFYAMPASRVGYAVCSAKSASAIRDQIDPWPVSTVALEAARAALSADEFGCRSRRANSEAREEFARALRGIGLSVFPSAANFLLARLPRGSGEQLSLWLETHRTLIRRCDSFPGLGDKYIRLAVRSREDNLRLASLIERWLTAV